ncbi:hypothetical protein FXO38_33225 [Capsicum annuum]|nr:hypothetical protein FXO38_33225 [Capsicum annuum]
MKRIKLTDYKSDSLLHDKNSYDGYDDSPNRYLDSDDEDLQNLIDEEMNRSHQSDQDKYLSISDDEKYDHQEDGVDEEEGTIHDDSYTDNQYTAGPVVGCALITSEDIETYVFVFKTWLAAMGETSPTVILTDQCESIKHYFWAGIMSTQRCESMHAFFDGYIIGQSSLKQFVGQYEVALKFKYEKEMESQASKREQLVRPTTMFDWDIQIYGHYIYAIYDFFRVHVARLPHYEIERHVDFDAVEGVEDQSSQGRSGGGRWGRRGSKWGGVCGSRGGRGDDANNIKIDDVIENDGAIFVGKEFLSVRVCSELVHLFWRKGDRGIRMAFFGGDGAGSQSLSLEENGLR